MIVRPVFGNAAVVSTLPVNTASPSAKAAFYESREPNNFQNVTLTATMPYYAFIKGFNGTSLVFPPELASQIQTQLKQHEAQWPPMMNKVLEALELNLRPKRKNVQIQSGTFATYASLFPDHTAKNPNEPILIIRNFVNENALKWTPGITDLQAASQNNFGVSQTLTYYPRKAGINFFTPVKGVVINSSND